MTRMREPLRFLPLDDSAVTRWRRPARLDFLHRLRLAPIADSELLHLSHYCPVAITLGDGGPRVGILLDPAMLRASPVGADGRWRHPYAPIALRNLPFRPGRRRAEIEIAPELLDDGDGHALRDDAGQPTEQFAKIAIWIERLRQGMRRLGEAAKLLVAAGVLAPLAIAGPDAPRPAETGFWTIDPHAFDALPAERAAALSADGCLPLDLAAACLFSRRLLARSISILTTDAATPRAPAVRTPDDFVEPLDLHVRLDSSPLFSVDLVVSEPRAASASQSHALKTDSHADA